jgi:hypothetical protein
MLFPVSPFLCCEGCPVPSVFLVVEVSEFEVRSL